MLLDDYYPKTILSGSLSAPGQRHAHCHGDRRAATDPDAGYTDPDACNPDRDCRTTNCNGHDGGPPGGWPAQLYERG